MSDKSIRQMLAREAAEAQSRRDQAPGKMFRSQTEGATSDVYTVRMPTERLAELRELASRRHEQPSALMRQWVLERLDSERTHQPDLADVRQTLKQALNKLDHITRRQAA